MLGSVKACLVHFVSEHVFVWARAMARSNRVSNWASVSPFRRTSIANVFLPSRATATLKAVRGREVADAR